MDRRDFLVQVGAGAAIATGLPPGLAATPGSEKPMRTRPIARSGERVPVVGMGTWLSFDVSPGDAEALARRSQVLERFFAGGGRLIDSSPMYGHAEAVLGTLLPALPRSKALFSATKVWTPIGSYGPTQMQRSLDLWGLPRCDLMQVHNLLNWSAHLPTLRRWRAEGRVRHLGLTTSHGNKHDTVRELLDSERDLDTLQITHNPADRRAEPLMRQAAARGMAVVLNRPFDGGSVLRRLRDEPLPPFAAELGCSAWAPLVLKWELAHPAVSCVIPATTDPDHMTQNLEALSGPMPDARQRAALTAVFDRIVG